MMKPADRVRAIYPDARAISGGIGRVEIWSILNGYLGTGANEPTAWIDAAAKLISQTKQSQMVEK